MWYHLSLFLDADELGVAYAGVTTATALSQVIGGPLAAALLLLDGKLGLHGWQWLFICEGIPTVIFAVFLKAGDTINASMQMYSWNSVTNVCQHACLSHASMLFADISSYALLTCAASATTTIGGSCIDALPASAFALIPD